METFKSQMVFELEKDNPFNSAKVFYEEIRKKYGLERDSDLYKRICNYQLEKYGQTLRNKEVREFVKGFGIRNIRSRMRKTINSNRRYQTQAFIERVTKGN